MPGLVLLLALVLIASANTAMPIPALAIGAVAPLDPWPSTPQMTGTTGNPTNVDFAISDGIDRLLVVLVCSYDSGGSSGQTFSATYGGRTLTEATLQNSNRRQTWIGYLKESDITGASDNVVTVTVTGTHTQVRGYVASYASVDQTTPITDAGGRYISFANNQTIGGPLDANGGGYAFYGWAGQAGRTRTSDTEGYAEDSDVNNTAVGTFNYGAASKPFAAAGTTNPSVTWSANNNVSVSFVTLNPDSAYPQPTITSISPTGQPVGGGSFDLTVDGTNFVNGSSVIRLDGADRATTFVSTTQLTATIPASDLATAGAKSITVFTTAPGGGTSNAQPLTVVKATPVITWANPAAIVYGTALSGTQLNATASVPGAFVYTPASGAMLPAGSGHALHVDFTPTDTANFNSASADVSVNVDKRTMSITAGSLDKAYGTAHTFAGTEFTAYGLVNGDTVSGIALTSAGAAADATVGGGPYPIVPGTAVGTGLGNYNIIYVNGSLTVDPRDLTITADDRSKTFHETVTFAETEFTVDGLVNGDTVTGVTLASAGAAADATLDGSPYLIVPSGSVGTGLDNYNITYVNGSLTVNRASIGLSLSSSASTSTQGRSVTFTANTNGTGAMGTVTFQDGDTILGSITLSDGTATFTISTLSVGSHSITAVYSGDANFAGSTSSAIDLAIDLPVKTAAGFNWWALVGGLIATDVLLGLLLLVLVLRRREKHAVGANAAGVGAAVPVGGTGGNHHDAGPDLTGAISAAALAAADTPMGLMALPTVEDVGTYSVQLERELERSIKKVSKSMDSAIQAICRTVETRDLYVAGHQKRVAELACAIGKEMGLAAWQIEGIRVAGLLHDIGKITVPTEILSKPGRLSAIEITMIKDHPKVAYDILKNVEFDWPIAQIVVQHHERMNGSGYPYGIPGKDILVEARILAVADVVEAMSSDRPYRPARGMLEAMAELARGEGTLYDPDVVRACTKVINDGKFKIELAKSHT